MFYEFETTEHHKVCINVNKIEAFWVSKEKDGTTLELVSGGHIRLMNNYDEVKRACKGSDL